MFDFFIDYIYSFPLHLQRSNSSQSSSGRDGQTVPPARPLSIDKFDYEPTMFPPLPGAEVCRTEIHCPSIVVTEILTVLVILLWLPHQKTLTQCIFLQFWRLNFFLLQFGGQNGMNCKNKSKLKNVPTYPTILAWVAKGKHLFFISGLTGGCLKPEQFWRFFDDIFIICEQL